MTLPKWNNKQFLIIVTTSWLGAAISLAPAAETEPDDHSQHAQQMDHSQHATDHSGHMDPSQHGSDHSAHREHAGHEDHSQHMAMMNQTGYERSLKEYPIPDLTLVNQQGERVSLKEVLEPEGPVMLNFIFTTCTTICPVMSATFAQVQLALGEEAAKVRMVSVSIDPEHDTPKRLREYAQRYDAGGNWMFLTGSYDDSIAAQKAFDAYRGSKMNHTPLTLMRSSPEVAWVRIDGLASAEEIVKEYRALSGE
jgi:protein SCO1/2